MFVGVLDRLGHLSNSQDCNLSLHTGESSSLSSYMSNAFLKFMCVCVRACARACVCVPFKNLAVLIIHSIKLQYFLYFLSSHFNSFDEKPCIF
jgi:hypothetical protein